MADPVHTDIIRLFRANPLLRDTDEVLATRLGRSLSDVQKALSELEQEGLVARRWVGNMAMFSFTGAPEPVSSPQLSQKATRRKLDLQPALSATLHIPSTLEGVSTGRSAVEGLCRAAGMEAGATMEFIIAVSEALTNAHRYGRRGDNRDTIRVDFKSTGMQVDLRVKDRGSGFPFILVGTNQGDVKSTGGRGLMLMRSLTDDLQINRTPTGTEVRLMKNLKSEEVDKG